MKTTRTPKQLIEHAEKAFENRKANNQPHPSNETIAGILRVPAILDHLHEDDPLVALLYFANHPPSGYCSDGDLTFIFNSLRKKLDVPNG
jgi:hypothetical protein